MALGMTVPQIATGALYDASIFTFKWVPATVISLYSTESLVIDPASPLQPITHPVTVSDAGNYLATIASPEQYQQIMTLWGVYVAFSIFISIILLAIIIYSWIRMKEIHHEEHDRLHRMVHKIKGHDHHDEVSPVKKQWAHIMQLAASDDEHGWRIAILEADIMLGNLLDSLGYKGETMGDKMKTINRSHFNTIDLAWEAHRTRNRVAHEGSNMTLSKREAQQTITQFHEVFKEFNLI